MQGSVSLVKIAVCPVVTERDSLWRDGSRQLLRHWGRCPWFEFVEIRPDWAVSLDFLAVVQKESVVDWNFVA